MIKQRDEERGGELGYNGILLHFIPLYPSSKPTNCTRKMCQVILTISEFILEMNKQGVTFILTTHDLGDIEQLAKRVIVINHGEMIFDNTIDALKSHLGTKKLVSITTQAPIPPLEIPGVLVKNKLSDYNAELELDVNIMELNQFIDYINKNSTINDMTLQELPIEEVIKKLYTI